LTIEIRFIAIYNCDYLDFFNDPYLILASLLCYSFKITITMIIFVDFIKPTFYLC